MWTRLGSIRTTIATPHTVLALSTGCHRPPHRPTGAATLRPRPAVTARASRAMRCKHLGLPHALQSPRPTAPPPPEPPSPRRRRPPRRRAAWQPTAHLARRTTRPTPPAPRGTTAPSRLAIFGVANCKGFDRLLLQRVRFQPPAAATSFTVAYDVPSARRTPIRRCAATCSKCCVLHLPRHPPSRLAQNGAPPHRQNAAQNSHEPG